MPSKLDDLHFRISSAKRGIIVAGGIIKILDEQPDAENYIYLTTNTKVMQELTMMCIELDKCCAYALGGKDARNEQCESTPELIIQELCQREEESQGQD
jgi:hypothetical protein